jgi:hypothetical protein
MVLSPKEMKTMDVGVRVPRLNSEHGKVKREGDVLSPPRGLSLGLIYKVVRGLIYNV